MSSVLTLADVLGRGVPVEWHEGVALVRAVSARLLETPGEGHAVPELQEIAISPDGRVDFEGGIRTDEPVRRLGQLLQATLMRSDLPVQLRLVISQATAPTPRFGSIREYDEALAYFERPDRDAVIQSLYTRALSTEPVGDSKSNSAPTMDAIAPLPTPERPKRAPLAIPTVKPRRAALIAGGILLLLVVCGAAAWYAGVGRGTNARREVSTIAGHASDAVGAAVVTGISAVTERVGLGRLVSRDAEASPPPVAPLPAKAPEVKRAAPVRTNGQVPSFRAFDLQPIPTARLPRAAATMRLPASPPPSERLSGVDAPEADPATYSLESAGVVPPIALWPQLPSELPAEVDRSDLGRIELLILTDGTVSTVRLLGAPRNVHDSMFLSAAKAWLFQPALKDGVPVKYRKVIWIARQ